MRRKAIKSYFMSKCGEKATPKDFWHCIQPYMSNKSAQQSNIILNEDGDIITNKKDIAKIFIEFFTSIADNIGIPDELNVSDETTLKTLFEKHESHSSVVNIKKMMNNERHDFDFTAVDEACVFKILSKVNVKKSTGCDQLPARMIKAADSSLCSTLTNLINSSLHDCSYPNDMKKAEISPLFKKKDDMSKENYRPVSILITFSKVFESIIANQLMVHFQKIFNVMLCAYRKKYGCDHVLVSLIDSWKNALDNDQFVGIISTDLSRAFDCIPHGLLISKMKAYGLSNKACLFMSSYLSDRMQRVKVENERSEWQHLKKGVPQGSCLGPVIFNIFTNDLFYVLKSCNLSNYADDNTIHSTKSSLDLVMASLKVDAENATKWFSDNYMQANASKFQFMLLRPLSFDDSVPNQIIVDDTEILRNDSIKFLGVTIDDKLKFDLHVSNLCVKAGRQLNVLYRFKNVFSIEDKKTLYQTFILSNFNYCPIVWNFCNTDMMRKMEYIQERALRFIYNDVKTNYRDMLTLYKHETLHIRRIKAVACEMFKTLNNLNPSFMKDMTEVKESNYDLRDTQKVIVPKFNTIRYGKNTFSYYAAHVWNLLPVEIKQNTELNTFKRLIKSWEGPKCSCSSCLFYV